MPFVPSSFLLVVVRPGAPTSSVLAPSSDARSPPSSFLLTREPILSGSMRWIGLVNGALPLGPSTQRRGRNLA